MKLDTKTLFAAAVSFVAGFLLCFALFNSAPKQQPPLPLATANPTLAFTQFQPRAFHVVLTQSFGPRLSIPVRASRDPLEEIEMMKHRSVDLIDRRSQPWIDLKESDK
jgi:hypothetical protein